MSGRKQAWQAPPDCLPCGRCCFSEDESYLQLFGLDVARMLPADERHLRRDVERTFMKLVGGRCSAFVVDALELDSPVKLTRPAGETRPLFGCSIYERRPDVCRALQRGTSSCRFEYERKFDRPDVLLADLRKKAQEAPKAR